VRDLCFATRHGWACGLACLLKGVAALYVGVSVTRLYFFPSLKIERENMKIFGTVLLCLLSSKIFAQTNFLTVTNNEGIVFKNIKVIKIDPDGLIYLIPNEGGGGKLKFNTLPAAIQRQYNYNPVAAQKADALKKDSDKKFAQQSADAAKAQLAAQNRAIIRRALVGRGSMILKVIQTTDNGMLIRYDCSQCDVDITTYFLVDSSRTYPDGTHFVETIYPIGNYTYTTVQHSKATVAKYTCDLEKAVDYWANFKK
jgi:hypothetical protein